MVFLTWVIPTQVRKHLSVAAEIEKMTDVNLVNQEQLRKFMV